MDGDLNNFQGDANNQFLQVDLTPRQRKISSPYPLYPFKKPEDYHPSYQQPASYQPQTYRTNNQPPAYPPQTYQPDYQPDYQPGDYPVNYREPSDLGDRPQRIYVHNAVQQGREARPSHSQRAVSADVNRRYGNRSETPEEQSDPAQTYRVASGKQDRSHRRKQGIVIPPIDHPPVVQSPDYHDNRRESVESDPDLHQGQGSMTDDDKLNESEKDRKLDQKRDITSDDEAERGLAILRQLHEHSEAARRLEESNDIREDEHDERRERSPEPQELREKVVESGSATPTNTDPDALSQEDSTMEEEEEEEEGGRAPQESPLDPQPHPFSPVTLLPPADMDVYYSLSKRRYHVAPTLSEPSHSRQISPGSNAGSFRAHSQLQGPIDDPGGRYARRATRANVLHRAERLLDSRLQTRLQSPPVQNSPRHRIHSPRMSSFAVSKRQGGTLNNQHRRRPSQLQRIREMSGRQKNIEQKFSDTRPVVKRVAFVDVGDEDWDDEVTSFRSTGRDRDPGRTSSVTSLSGAMVPREEGAGNVSRLSTSRRHYSHNQRSSDVMFPLRRRTGKKTGGGWFTGKKPGLRGSSRNSHQTFSGSEDEGAPHYGPRSYNDPSRYEMTRAPPPLPPIPLYRPEGEQGASGGPHKRARRVWFFRNGDPDSRARLVVVSKKMYPNLDSLLLALENVVPIVSGVKHIFSLPEGRKVKAVRELQDGCYYVCSSVNRFYDVKYGDVREQYWKAGKVTHDESHLFSRPNPLDLRGDLPSPPSSRQQHHRHHHHHHPHHPGEGGALVVTLISNLQRDSQEKLILNPHTALPFPSLLHDLHLMVHLPHPPATGIYTLTRPHVKVEGYNQLFHKFRDHKAFLVCGEEGPPQEPPSQPSTPPPRKGKRSQRPGRTTPRRGSFRRTEAVHCEINGKKKELFAPSQMHVDVEGKKPQQRLKLDWVYGYRGRDVRQNLVVLPNTGEVVYFVAAVVILYDRQTHTQKHYTGHTEEVTCLALHPTNPYVASGQLAGPAPEEAAHVRVWDALTLSTCAVVGLGHFSHGVASLSFSHGESDLLLAMEDSERHVMTVWDWSRQDLDVPLARTTTTSDPVVLGCFYPFDPKILITFGKQHLYFWTIFWNQVDGKIMRDKKSGVFEGEIPNFVTSVCFTPNRDVITGDSSGSVMVWTPDEGDIFRMNYHASQPMTSAHTKSVSSLVLLADGMLLSGGGSEIKAWDSRKGYELLLSRELPEVYGTVRQLVSLTPDLEGPVLIGTSKDFLLEGSLRSGFRPLVQGHCEEVWTVKAHPKEETFFTAGHDAYVIKWSSRDHRPVWTARDSKPCTSMAVDPRGQLVAVGMTSGKVTLYGAKDGKERNSFQAGQAQVNALTFTPADNSGRVQLAVGCHDGFIYLYTVQEDGRVEGQRSAKARHSNMYVMHLDWSTDGRYLQSVLGDYDLVFWDVHNLIHTKAGRTMRDVEWNSCTAPVGYPLVGAWNWLDSGEAINVACRSGDQSCLLTGDSRGRLRLFTYPTIAPRPEFRQVKPFSSNTTATEFLYKDAGVLTSGGSDAAVLQYALEYR